MTNTREIAEKIARKYSQYREYTEEFGELVFRISEALDAELAEFSRSLASSLADNMELKEQLAALRSELEKVKADYEAVKKNWIEDHRALRDAEWKRDVARNRESETFAALEAAKKEKDAYRDIALAAMEKLSGEPLTESLRKAVDAEAKKLSEAPSRDGEISKNAVKEK